MNVHATETQVAKLRSLPDVVAEYDTKLSGLAAALAAFEASGAALKAAASIGGEYGQETIDTGYVRADKLERNLRRSAWLHIWKGLNLPAIASASDKKLWEHSMADPPAFTLDNLRATFGPYLENTRATILRGLAEVFADLDPAYKSHEKVKIGVKGLPKRIILPAYGRAQIQDVLNALAAYQGRPLPTHQELAVLNENGDALRDGGEYPDPFESRHVQRARMGRGEPQKMVRVPARGIWVRHFINGNRHLFFGPDALRDINRALAEFYGDVLPDCPDADEERPAPRASTEVAKDLQFYPTPQKVIDIMLSDLRLSGKHVLEPSCGDGRLMVAIKRAGAASVTGIEFDRDRADKARMWGMPVQWANFLVTIPNPVFDLVIMNPPFYGRHYAKHVRHALRFLKPGGTLIAILPATARYDHGLLDDLGPNWRDLPVGAFAESGTNICTTIATIKQEKTR